jgi:ADP-L-glycero-D-manno-heptose 6-epimerase
MYIVTGGAGLIGSAFIAKLNQEGITDIIVVDELGTSDKWKNLRNKKFTDYLHKDTFKRQIESGHRFKGLKAIVHMGACSSTTEQNVDFLMENNYRYTGILGEFARTNKIQFIYASSAATYGDGAQSYSDDDTITPTLLPLNPYGYSKQLYDLYVLREKLNHKFVGLKFFNVFGPNEAHKGPMRSMVLKAYEQIKSDGKVRLFESYKPEFKDGEQMRDFIYVKDCVEILFWLLNTPRVTGIFNIGSGKACSWNELAHAVFTALNLPPSIEYIPMPPELRNQYQYFTEAPMGKLQSAGCPIAARPLEEAVRDYVVNYLECDRTF